MIEMIETALIWVAADFLRERGLMMTYLLSKSHSRGSLDVPVFRSSRRDM